jgi:DNA-binding MarR family transcriptional regulator
VSQVVNSLAIASGTEPLSVEGSPTAEQVPDVCSCIALRQATRHVTRLYDDLLAPIGLGINQYSILSRLDRLGPKALQELAELLVMDRSTLGHLLRPLETRKLVKIKPSPHDRRVRVISLTDSGVALIKRARPLWAKAERRFEAAFGAENADKLRTVLRQVTLVEFDHG